MSYRCRAEHIIIRCGTNTAFSVFDSYVEPNLSNLMTNQAKCHLSVGKEQLQFKVKYSFV